MKCRDNERCMVMHKLCQQLDNSQNILMATSRLMNIKRVSLEIKFDPRFLSDTSYLCQ